MMTEVLSNEKMNDTPRHVHQAVVAAYQSYDAAEAAVGRLAAGGLPTRTLSIVGRNFEPHVELQAEEFLVVVHGTSVEVALAPELLERDEPHRALANNTTPEHGAAK